MRRIFWGFCRNWFLMSPLRYISGRSDFGFLFEKRTIQGGDNSLHHWYPESATPRITDMESWLFFKRKLSVSMIRRVVNSPHQWYGESATPRIVESESRLLRVSPIWRVDDSTYRWVDDSAYRWYREFSFDFQYFKHLKHAFNPHKKGLFLAPM